MKKIFTILCIGIVTIFTIPTGCVKPANNGTGGVPDISDFAVAASTVFKAGAQASVKILSSSLGDGTFTVSFDLTGKNVLSGGTATLTMSGGSGTFVTPLLTHSGPTTVIITSISNSAGGALVSSNNTSSMFDSTGVMNATYTPVSGSPQTLYATDVTASWLGAGSTLAIYGTIWTPNLINISLYYAYYGNTISTTTFNSDSLTTQGLPYSTFNGHAVFQETGTSLLINQPSHFGSVTISTISPLLSGSFSYTTNDGSVIAGTFTCPHP